MPLFAFGSNGSGQLGLGHTDDISLPARCLFDNDYDNDSDNDNDGDGRVPSQSRDKKDERARITGIAAGGNHTVILFRDGSVYAAGMNADGRCGICPSSSAAAAAAASAAEGGGEDAGEEELVLRFQRVVLVDPETGDTVDRFKDVSAMWEATVLVSTVRGKDVVFVVGSGVKGELGLGERVTRAVLPVRMPGFGDGDGDGDGDRVVAVGSGMGHSVVVMANGEVYGWGAARKGQLGESVRERKIAWEPVKVDGIPFRATGAVCGREFTVIMGDRTAGEFVILGSADNKWGVVSDIPAPGSLAGYTGIYASWHGVCVHQRDSSVHSWGRNDRGQLPPLDLPKPKKLAIGSEHGLAVLGDRVVVAFGWGEHGNCGPETDAQGNVKEGYNTIPMAIEEGASVVGIAAGCATSWIITS